MVSRTTQDEVTRLVTQTRDFIAECLLAATHGDTDLNALILAVEEQLRTLDAALGADLSDELSARTLEEIGQLEHLRATLRANLAAERRFS